MASRHMFIFPKGNSLPSGWSRQRFGDVAGIGSGYGFPIRYQGRSDGPYPFFKVADISRATELSETYLREANHYITDSDCRELNAKPFPAGSTVFAKIGAAVLLNRRAILSQDSLVDNNVMVITPDSRLLSNQYAYYVLLNIDMAEYVNMTAVPSVRRSDVANTLLLIPPLREQHNAAEVLGILDETIAQIRRLIEKLRAIKSGLLHDLLTRGIGEEGRVRDIEKNPEEFRESELGMIPKGWLVKKISELAEINSASLRSSTDLDYEIEYLDISSIERPGKVNCTTTMKMSSAPSRARRIVRSGDVIVSTVRPYLKAFAFIEDAPRNLIASTGFAVLSHTEQVLPSFLFQTVLSEPFIHHLTRRMTGSNYPAVVASDVGDYTLPCPPVEEQKQISETLYSLDLRISSEESYYEKMARLKRGLMYDILTGRARVKIPK